MIPWILDSENRIDKSSPSVLKRIEQWNYFAGCTTITKIVICLIAFMFALFITPHEEVGRIDRRNVIS